MQNQTRQLSGNRERRGAGSTYVCVLSHCGKESSIFSFSFFFSFLVLSLPTISRGRNRPELLTALCCTRPRWLITLIISQNTKHNAKRGLADAARPSDAIPMKHGMVRFDAAAVSYAC